MSVFQYVRNKFNQICLEKVERVFQHINARLSLFLYLTFYIIERSFDFVNTFLEHSFCFLYNITLRVPNSALATTKFDIMNHFCMRQADSIEHIIR